MCSKGVVRVGLLPLLVIGVLCRPSHAGPLHEEAMGLVEDGQRLREAGDLDAAMAVFEKVEDLYPDETLAIGWARFHHSDCLLAAGRQDEVTAMMRPVWQQIQVHEITDPNAGFLFCHQYARVMPAGYMAETISRKALEFYELLEDPGPEMREKAGYLLFFLARSYYLMDRDAEAAAAARQAWQIGRELSETVDPTLAEELGLNIHDLMAWARLEQAQAEVNQGNVLLAQSLLVQCEEEYVAGMKGQFGYDDVLESLQEQCRMRMGFVSDARGHILERLANGSDDPDIDVWISTALRYAEDACARNAREEAIALIAVAHCLYIDRPVHGGILDRYWREEIRGAVPPGEFVKELEDRKSQGSPVEQAAIRVELAEVLADLNRGEEGLAILNDPSMPSAEPRFGFARAITAARCEHPRDRLAEVEALTDALANDNLQVDPAYVMEQVCERLWKRRESPTYGEWLDENRDRLPESEFRLEKARFLRDYPREYGAAIKLVEPLLQASDLHERRNAHYIKVTSLYCSGDYETANAALREFEEAFPNDEEREHGFFMMGDYLRRYRPEHSMMILDRGLATRRNRIWTHDIFLAKARLHYASKRPGEALTVLQDLLADELTSISGEGMLLAAKIHQEEWSDLDTARGFYEEVLASPEIMQPILAEAYERYAAMELKHGSPEAAVEICGRAASQLSHSHLTVRGRIALLGALALKAGGRSEESRAALERLLEYPDPGVRAQAARALREEVRP